MLLYEICEQGLTDLLELQDIPYTNMDITSLFKQRESYYVEDNIAYIHIFGPLVRNASVYDKMTSITDYADIEEELEMAANDFTVQYVIMKFDSPGGESQGSQEIADMVESFTKPVIAIVEGCCASAAYKIASACTYIYSTVSSEVGSIGSIIVITNTKQAMNSQGVKREIIFNNGAIYKSTAQDFGDITPEQRTYLQDKVDYTAAKFHQTVLNNRIEVSQEAFTAAMYPSEIALELGLIDGVIY
jgi:signal peptide peptidase SppA